MKLRRFKEGNQDICAIKTPYLTNLKEFIHETGFSRFYAQQEHAVNWFHNKRINGLEDMSFLNQKWSNLLYLEDRELMLCQTHYWHPDDFVLLLKEIYTTLWSTIPHWIRRIPITYPEDEPELFMASLIRNWFLNSKPGFGNLD